MNYWLLLLTLLNILLMSFLFFTQLMKNKTKVEDQRLTKGLQLLQNKISILQDLSDKTDEQVNKWINLLEQKSADLQAQLIKSDDKIAQIEQALSKALDVSKIFYEQVPQQELIERQKTSKYVQAAKLAHQGFSVEQIMQKIEISKGEIEMIAKLNRDDLQFSEEQLPAWLKASNEEDNLEERVQELNDFSSQLQKMGKKTSNELFEVSKPDLTNMNQIKQQFTDTIAQNSTQIPQTFLDEQKHLAAAKLENGKTIRPFEFKKIMK